MKTFDELKAAIVDNLNREDIPGNLTDFIRLAETKIYRRLRTRDNEFQKTYLAADDPFNPITLPQNYLEMKLVLVNDRPVERISDQEYQARVASALGDLSADKHYFATLERALYLYPWPTETQTAEEWGDNKVVIHYWGSESLTDMATWDTPTNPNQVPESAGTPPATTLRPGQTTTRLYQMAPDLFLYAALAEANMFLKDPQTAQMYAQMAGTILDALEEQDAMADLAGSTVSVSSIYYDGVG